jgi:putative DNA primase/helicase
MKNNDLKFRIEEYLQSCGVQILKPETRAPKLQCPNPNHADEKPSAILYRDSSRVYCPVCSGGGNGVERGWDVFDVCGLINGTTDFAEQKKIVGKALNAYEEKPIKKKKVEKKLIAVKPQNAINVFSREEIERRATLAGWGKPVKSWYYTDTEGAITAIDVRFEKAGNKSVITFWFDGEKIRSDSPPPLIYGLDGLKAKPHSPILIVEGCKCASAVSDSLKAFVGLSWAGGSSKANRPDWSILKDRTVYIYPDDDRKALPNTGEELPPEKQPGIRAALEIQKQLPKAIIIPPLPSARKIKPDGADIIEALEVTTPEKLERYILDSEPLKIKIDQKKTDEKEGVRDGWEDRLLSDKKGVVILTLANILIILKNDSAWLNVLAYNERTLQVVFRKNPPADIGAKAGDVLTDEHVTRTTIWLQDYYRMAIKSNGIAYSAMIAVAHENRFDPVKEWLESLPPWDATRRLDLWLTATTGCEDNLYTQSVGRKTLISAVARVMEPGCKVDSVLILHGPQGTLKSTFLAELAGRTEWFTDHISDIGSKDAAMQLAGPWILEFSELDAITSKRESERVKSWITQKEDRFRPPYGRSVVQVPRRVIFTGTSNLKQFLRDETGGRRFLPIEIREIDLKELRKIKTQLWCEALHQYRAGESWWLEGEALESAKVEQEDRRLQDPWEDVISDWLRDTEHTAPMDSYTHERGHRVYTTATEVLTRGIKMEASRQTKADLDRCGRILGSVLGWSRGTRRVKELGVIRVWYPPERKEENIVDLKPVGEQGGLWGDEKGGY